MTFKDHPTDVMDNPDGRDYHYRFQANDKEAWKRLKYARWKGRYIKMNPKDMKHLRVQIDHVTVKTYDKMGYIKGMKQYAKSPGWETVPHSRGKMEMKNANGGGTKIQAEEYTGEKWGTVTVDFTIDATPTEVKGAYENGVDEASITHSINSERSYAVDEEIDRLRQELHEYQDNCNHDHVIRDSSRFGETYCEDCGIEWRDDREIDALIEADEMTVVSST